MGFLATGCHDVPELSPHFVAIVACQAAFSFTACTMWDCYVKAWSAPWTSTAACWVLRWVMDWLVVVLRVLQVGLVTRASKCHTVYSIQVVMVVFV